MKLTDYVDLFKLDLKDLEGRPYLLQAERYLFSFKLGIFSLFLSRYLAEGDYRNRVDLFRSLDRMIDSFGVIDGLPALGADFLYENVCQTDWEFHDQLVVVGRYLAERPGDPAFFSLTRFPAFCKMFGMNLYNFQRRNRRDND